MLNKHFCPPFKKYKRNLYCKSDFNVIFPMKYNYTYFFEIKIIDVKILLSFTNIFLKVVFFDYPSKTV